MTKAKAKVAPVAKIEKAVVYIVAQPFRDKFSKRFYEAGDDASVFDTERRNQLQKLGLITEA